jgi:hypothetical protein
VVRASGREEGGALWRGDFSKAEKVFVEMARAFQVGNIEHNVAEFFDGDGRHKVESERLRCLW